MINTKQCIYQITKKLILDELSIKSISLPTLKLIKVHYLCCKIELDLFSTEELKLINLNYEKSITTTVGIATPDKPL